MTGAPDTWGTIIDKFAPYLQRYSRESRDQRCARLVELFFEGPNGVGIMASDQHELRAVLHNPDWSPNAAGKK
jgi:hypothetical protein